MSNPAYGHGSDVGLLREHNEDSYVLCPDMGLWLVADGMGGHQGGEVASKLVTSLIPPKIAAGVGLATAIAEVHHDIRQAVTDGVGARGMGSTVVALQLGDAGNYQVCWVGDSRAYLWDGQELRQLTRDHSFVQKMVDKGAISHAEAVIHPQRNVISQALGANDLSNLEVETLTGTFCRGDQILLCSDGLTSEITDDQIAEILKSDENNQLLVDSLISAAKKNGGKDNITIIILSAPDNAPTRTGKGGTRQIDTSALNSCLGPNLTRQKSFRKFLYLVAALLVSVSLVTGYWWFLRDTTLSLSVGETSQAMPPVDLRK